MILIDTHTHLYGEDFDADRTEMIQRAQADGVEKFYLPAIDSAVNGRLLEMEADFPGICFAMAGLHPCSVKENFEGELRLVQQQLEQRRFSAIGETGLDFYWDRNFDSQQYIAFEKQIQWAKTYGVPLVIHSRNSMRESLDTVRKYAGADLWGIFHCFSGTLEEAREAIDMNFALGIGGVVTYKKSGLPEVVKAVGLDHIVLETDAPYLTPVPYRGKRNESAYLRYIAGKIAETLGVDVETVASATTANAQKIFRD